MYVVAGVSGHTGRAAAESLLEQGRRVRVLVRDPKKGEEWREKGADVAAVSLDDAMGLARALSGADGAYLLVPPAYGAPDVLAVQRGYAAVMAEAIRASGISHVALLSSTGAQHETGTGLIRALHFAEQTIRPAATNLTLLRAAYFLENWAAVLGEAREKGLLPTFLTPDRPIAMIATRDVGRAAARALAEPAEGPRMRVVELAGPADLSPEDVAREISEILGRDVRVLGLPLDAVVPAMTAMGMSRNGAELFQEMMAGVNSGRVAFEGEPTDGWRGAAGVAGALGPILDAGGSEGV